MKPNSHGLVWLELCSNDEVMVTQDIKRKGLNDVVFNAIALQELGARHQAQDDHGITDEAKLAWSCLVRAL
jgi:hypothetical protein